MTWGRRKDLKIINEQDLEQLRVKSPKFWKIEGICFLVGTTLWQKR